MRKVDKWFIFQVGVISCLIVSMITHCAQEAHAESPPPLSEMCAMASLMIRDNDCGQISCDCGLYLALKAGCRIHSWGHTPVPCKAPPKESDDD